MRSGQLRERQSNRMTKIQEPHLDNDTNHSKAYSKTKFQQQQPKPKPYGGKVKPCCSYGICVDQKYKRTNSFGVIDREILRKYVIFIVYAWLFMNVDSGYSQRARRSLQASSISRRSFFSPFGGGRRGHNDNGLNAVEAIALIHAMNSNPVGARQAAEQHLGDLGHILNVDQQKSATRPSVFSRQAYSSNSAQYALAQRQQSALERQVPVPIPVPVPAPVPTPVAALAAAVAAFVAAVFAGLTPFAAVAAAAAAALAALFAAALLAIIIALLAVPKVKKQAPIIKKLVIKKTVLPFVIPIPFKKKEKEIVYKYIHKPVHVHHEKKKKKSKYYEIKMKKSDDSVSKLEDDISQPREVEHLDKIQSLLSEQDRLQTLVDDIVKNNKTSLDTSMNSSGDNDVSRRSGSEL